MIVLIILGALVQIIHGMYIELGPHPDSRIDKMEKKQ